MLHWHGTLPGAAHPPGYRIIINVIQKAACPSMLPLFVMAHWKHSLIPEFAPTNKLRLPIIKDTLAEQLRRRPAKPMGSPRVGSNPTGVVLAFSSNGPELPCSASESRFHSLSFKTRCHVTQTLWPSG